MEKEKTTRIPTVEKLACCILVDWYLFCFLTTSTEVFPVVGYQIGCKCMHGARWWEMQKLYDLQTFEFEHTVPYHVKSTCTFTVLYYVVELTADETE